MHRSPKFLILRNLLNKFDLKAARLRLGYKNRKALAEVLGVSVRAIDSWEQGWRPIPDWVGKFIALLENRKTLI